MTGLAPVAGLGRFLYAQVHRHQHTEPRQNETTLTNKHCHRSSIAVYVYIATIAYTYGLFTDLVHTGLAPVVVLVGIVICIRALPCPC